MTAALLEQFPRFSAYDPGATGEGSLDPLGIGSVADRIADRLAPGVRARMSQPRFVTLAAIGAYACQPISELRSSDGKSTFDLAFEWLVVESLVRYPDTERLRGLPGSQKAQRAARTKERLGSSTYLAGPRVFGFTGVYRPFSIDAKVLGSDDLPAEKAEPLIHAWERGAGLTGFVHGATGSPGLRVRRAIERECLAALENGRVTAPQSGWLMRQIADTMAPREAKRAERGVLQNLIKTGPHEVRNELTELLARDLPGSDRSQVDIAEALLPKASLATRQALLATIKFETCATRIEYAFRRLLAYATAIGGAFSIEQATATPLLGELAPHLGTLTREAVDAVAELDESLASEVAECLALFDRSLEPEELVTALIARHQHVQEMKGKRMWIDPLKSKWIVRTPYRNQSLDLVDEIWTHPMRLPTLAAFLRATA